MAFRPRVICRARKDDKCQSQHAKRQIKANANKSNIGPGQGRRGRVPISINNELALEIASLMAKIRISTVTTSQSVSVPGDVAAVVGVDTTLLNFVSKRSQAPSQ